MTNKEINSLIKKSKSTKFLESLEIELNYAKINFHISFKGFLELYIFIKRQQKGWNKIEIELPTNLKNSKEYFDDFYKGLIDLITLDKIDDGWNSLSDSFVKSSNYNYDNDEIFTFDSPITSFLIELFKKDESVFNGGFSYLFNNIENYNLKNKNYFIGIIKAYEFEQQDPKKVLKRSRYERSSLNRLRNDFESFIVKSNKTILDLSKEMEELKSTKNKSFDSWLKNVKKREENRFIKTKQSDSDYSIYSISRSKELEELYSEKLMLSKPAEYWNKRAITLKYESKRWLISLLVAIVISVSILFFLIIKISNETLVHMFNNTGSAIRWSIILITLISFLAYSIKIFSKLAMSSYHLARDAEERKQLVYVYLSLKNQKAITENERILILQSIFSRSDTGLLKEDSSPTMPSSSIIEKIMNHK